MACWIEHTLNTWIVEDKASRIVALIKYRPRTSLYCVKQHHKKIGYYRTLEAAKMAADLYTQSVEEISQTKPTRKPPQDLPWN